MFKEFLWQIQKKFLKEEERSKKKKNQIKKNHAEMQKFMNRESTEIFIFDQLGANHLMLGIINNSDDTAKL